MVHTEITDKSHSIYVIENGNRGTDLNINVVQDLKKAAFDMKTLKEQGDTFQGKSL